MSDSYVPGQLPRTKTVQLESDNKGFIIGADGATHYVEFLSKGYSENAFEAFYSSEFDEDDEPTLVELLDKFRWAHDDVFVICCEGSGKQAILDTLNEFKDSYLKDPERLEDEASELRRMIPDILEKLNPGRLNHKAVISKLKEILELAKIN